jgi:hypothetical protein
MALAPQQYNTNPQASDAGARSFYMNNPGVISADLHNAFTDIFKNSTALSGVTDHASIRAAVEAHAAATEAMIFEALSEGQTLEGALKTAGQNIVGQSASLQKAGVEGDFLMTVIALDVANQNANTSDNVDQYNMPDDLGRSYDERLKETADIHGAISEQELAQMAADNTLRLEDLEAAIEEVAYHNPTRKIEIVPDLIMVKNEDKQNLQYASTSFPAFEQPKADQVIYNTPSPGGSAFG